MPRLSRREILRMVRPWLMLVAVLELVCCNSMAAEQQTQTILRREEDVIVRDDVTVRRLTLSGDGHTLMMKIYSRLAPKSDWQRVKRLDRESRLWLT